MIKISRQSLSDAANQRPEGYLEEVLSCAVGQTDTFVKLRRTDFDRLRRKYNSSENSPSTVSFVYPFWQGGANYDELRWSIRSIYQNFKPADGQTFNIVIVGDQPVIRRTNETWYNGLIIPSPRIRKGKTFRPKLTDALHKWRLALSSDIVSDTIVWMMDDIYFLRPFTLETLSIPRAFKNKSIDSIERWKEKSGFSSAKKRSMQLLYDAGLPMWDFATHLPHVVNRDTTLEVFEKFNIQENEVLWEVLYENYVLGDRKPVRANPYLAYFTDKQSEDRIGQLAKTCSVMVNGGGSWNEELRRFLYHEFPNRAPCEIIDAPPPKPREVFQGAWLHKVATCPHRGSIQNIVRSNMCSRRGVELPVFQCQKFEALCTIDIYKSGQPERICKQCEVMHDE